MLEIGTRAPSGQDAELMVVELLGDCQGGLTTAAIADELDVSESWARIVVARLAEAGVVKGEPMTEARNGRPPTLWRLARAPAR